MGIGNIITKMASYVLHTKAGKGLTAAVTKKAGLPAQSIISKVETNSSGRILRMQEAKQAFTPYVTKVTKESVPTMQKINEITGVARGNVKDAKGYFNKQRAADALAAFKHEPLKPSVDYVGKAYSTSIPTQKAIDDMLGIVENTPHTRLELLRKRAEIRNVFNGIQAQAKSLTKVNEDKFLQYNNEFKKIKANLPGSDKFFDKHFTKLANIKKYNG